MRPRAAYCHALNTFYRNNNHCLLKTQPYTLFSDEKSSDVAVKVLFNFYAASPYAAMLSERRDDGLNSAGTEYLTKQRGRECNLRPANDHPNIVPVLGSFFDKAPASPKNLSPGIASQDRWPKADEFPYGFGGCPDTCYIVMPKYVHPCDFVNYYVYFQFFLCILIIIP